LVRSYKSYETIYPYHNVLGTPTTPQICMWEQNKRLRYTCKVE
jgi:hypothetical protein